MSNKQRIIEIWKQSGGTKNRKEIAKEVNCSSRYVWQIIKEQIMASDISALLRYIIDNADKLPKLTDIQKPIFNRLLKHIKKVGVKF